MRTSEMKKYLRVNELPYWAVARKMGCCENTLYRMLRGDEMKPEDEKRIREAVEDLVSEEACKHG